MSDTTLFLDTSSYSGPTVRLHPVVLFSILDHYVRRNDNQDRVIGTLLGVNHEGMIEIKNSFPVPHVEGDQVSVKMDYHREMYELHAKANPKETVIGWYATGSDVNEHSVLIHECYWRETQQPPIHLIVDTNLTGGSMDIKAFISSNIGFRNTDKILGAHFQPIRLELDSVEAERIAVGVLAKAKSDTYSVSNLLSDLGTLEVDVARLLKIIETICDHVDKVVAGEVSADKRLGRFLASTIASLPQIDRNAFDKMFNNSLQDLLMVVYLSNLTRTQLGLAERLQRL